MRIDPSTLGTQLRELTGGAADAADGQQTGHDAAVVAAAVTGSESLEQGILARMRARQAADAATVVVTLARAQELAEQIAAQTTNDPGSASAAQGRLMRDRIRDLLGE